MTDCVIFAGAEMDTAGFNSDTFKDKYIICADRGFEHANALGLSPDLIVGDFDSLGYSPKADCEVMAFKPEKDDTDLMIALKQAISRGFKGIDIYAALGGRLDHTFASIQSLNYALEHGVKARLISETDTVELLSAGKYSFEQMKGYTLSLFSYSSNVRGLCISGAKYSVNEITIDNTFPIGVSNEITENKALISFSSGKLLVIQSLCQ